MNHVHHQDKEIPCIKLTIVIPLFQIESPASCNKEKFLSTDDIYFHVFWNTDEIKTVDLSNQTSQSPCPRPRDR